MEWIYLFIAGLFETGWPLGFKLSQQAERPWLWIAFSGFTMALSGYFLWLAQRAIPIGTAYSVWTGIGATATLLIGIFFFQDPVSFGRLFFVFLIIAGVVGLKVIG